MYCISTVSHVLPLTSCVDVAAVCGRVEVPRPVQLGSLKSENEGQDPGIRLVPAGGGGWGRPDQDVEEEKEDPQQRLGLLVLQISMCIMHNIYKWIYKLFG